MPPLRNYPNHTNFLVDDAFLGHHTSTNDHPIVPHTANPLLSRPGGYGGFGNDDEDEDDQLTDPWQGRAITPDGGRPSAAQHPYPRRKESLDMSWKGGHERTKTQHSYTSSISSVATSRQTKMNGYGGFNAAETLAENPMPPLPRTNGYGGFDAPPPPKAEERAASPAGFGGYGGFAAPPPVVEDRSATPVRANGYGGFDAPSPQHDDGSVSPGTQSIYSDFEPPPPPPPRAEERIASPARTNGYGGFDAPPPLHEERTASPARLNGYGGFDTPKQRPESSRDALEAPPFAALTRSETFPRPNYAQEAQQYPPRKGSIPERLRQNSTFDESRQVSMGPDLTRVPPPRGGPIRPSTSVNVDLAAEFGSSNPYHTPSESGSSGRSTFSNEHSYTSSQTSPARSQVPRKSHPSTHMSDMMNEVQASMNDLHVNTGPRGPLRTPSPLAETQRRLSPEPLDAAAPPQPPAPSTHLHRQNSGDPGYSGAHSGSPTRLGRSPTSQHSPPPLRKVSTDPTRSKGDCKGCRMPITGKCISSKDGRLTGKYHKECFVCTTCTQPFTSAEFYVLSDLPYCERDYHHLNGSLCGGCGNGIEGEYLEDEAFVKYHTGCFRCLDCGFVLAEGYFEVEGRAYCERDAMARLQAQQVYNPPPPAPYNQGFRGSGGGMPRPGPGRGGRPPPGMRPLPPSSSASSLSGGRPGPGSRMGPGMRPPGRGGPRGPPPSAGMPRMNKRMTRMGNM